MVKKEGGCMEEEKTREFPEPEGSGTKQYLEEMQRIFAVREATVVVKHFCNTYG